MGHTRLGKIPKSRKWRAVVEAISASDDELTPNPHQPVLHIEDIAKKTIEAAEGGLRVAIDDQGLHFTFYLLSQITLASRSEDWQERLGQLGVQINPNSSFQDLTVEIQAAIDDFIFSNGKPSDISEIAQQAAGEAISTLTSDKAVTLFSANSEDLRNAVYKLSTKKGFSDLGQKFFGVFMARYLNFYLSRVTATHLGNQRLAQVGDINRFDDALQLHCEQSARIVRDFCGEWYSKTEFTQGIDLENTKSFMAVAIKKLQAELRQQGAEE